MYCFVNIEMNDFEFKCPFSLLQDENTRDENSHIQHKPAKVGNIPYRNC